MPTNNNLSINTIYQNLNDLQNRLAKNSQDIAKIQSKLQLATPTQISNMLIDINNLQHSISVISENLKKIEKQLTQTNGKFNQSIIKFNELSNKISALQKKHDDDTNKFFSWCTAREVFVGVLLAIILAVGGNVCSNFWTSYIQNQASKINPQIKFSQEQINNNFNNKHSQLNLHRKNNK